MACLIIGLCALLEVGQEGRVSSFFGLAADLRTSGMSVYFGQFELGFLALSGQHFLVVEVRD